MAKKDPKIDAYIKKAPPYAKPILKRLRAIVHKGCPGVSETIKWRAPFFLYGGKIVCGMPAFKKHCALIFWKGSWIVKAKGTSAKAALKQLRRISSLNDLPAERQITAYIQLVRQLNEPGVKLARQAAKPVPTPSYLMRALRSNPKALATFKTFSTSNKKDYIFWISGAKTAQTRARRIKTALEWMAQGKSRQWKYLR